MTARIIERNGGQRRGRTADTRIFSPLLYQLSYLAGCSRICFTKGEFVSVNKRFGDVKSRLKNREIQAFRSQNYVDKGRVRSIIGFWSLLCQ